MKRKNTLKSELRESVRPSRTLVRLTKNLVFSQVQCTDPIADPVGLVCLSKTTWFTTRYMAASQLAATATTVSDDDVQHRSYSNNH